MVVATVFAALSASGAVTALVPATRITPLQRPQGSAIPAITLQRISTAPFNNFVDDGGLDSNLVQIDYYGDDYTALKTIADTCRTTLYAADIQMESEIDAYEPDTDPELYHITQTWTVFTDT